mgnify:CR=1 FL=1
MKLLIHHHTLAYIDDKGIWVQSFIGAWATEIAVNIDEVGLLLHTTSLKSEKLDYCISCLNVKLESLGENRGWRNRTQRLRSIKKKCKSLYNYSHLIVRGVTPRQLLVINSSPIKNKFFLFVGCVSDAQNVKINGFQAIINLAMIKYRNYELKKISKQSLFAANSHVTVNELNEKFNIPAVFIPTNTISIKYFKKVQRKKSTCFRILFVGRVTQDKGIEELISAFQKIKQIHTKKNFIFDVVGPYSSYFIEEMRNKYPQDFEKITFHGFIQFGAELLEFYDKSDVYVLPSYHEGFPHTIWEAAARQLPIICTSVGGIPGIIDNTLVTFIEKKNVDSIINALYKVLRTSEDIDHKAQKIWRIAKNNTVEESATKLITWMAS